MPHESKIPRMANQIATFFSSQPEAERVSGVASHINKFWEPRMRREFFALVDAGGEGMMPLVIEASKQVNRPAAKEAAG
jgi:formate dehydrogenase subunit delta